MGDRESSQPAGKEKEETVIKDPRAGDAVKKKEALEAVKRYLEEKSTRMGPCYLQLVAEALKANKGENLDELKEKLIRRNPPITELISWTKCHHGEPCLFPSIQLHCISPRQKDSVESSAGEFEKLSSLPSPGLKKEAARAVKSSSSDPEKLLKKPLSEQVVSPSKVETKRVAAGRRRTRRWSTLEEDTLREAVKRHSKGSWKLIKKSYAEVFEERTEVDLKDKWRNMTRC